MTAATTPVRIVGFMPTPFTDDDRVAGDQLAALAARIAAQGIEPAVLGGMGEYYALDRGESRDCMAAVIEGAGDVPTVAGIGWSTREAVEVASDAMSLGIATVVVNPPHYAAPSPRAYAEHVRRVTDAAGVGAIVYSAGHFPMTDEYIEHLTKVDGFRGVKEEHYGVDQTAQRIRHWGERVQWWGVGEIEGSAYARVGADTVTTSLANLRPDLARRAITALAAGSDDREAVRAATEWTALLGADGDGAPAFLTEVMHRSAGWNRRVRLPLLSSQESAQRAVQAFVDEWSESRIGTAAV